eukprot:487415-Prorocentrum_minimum.AAC.1
MKGTWIPSMRMAYMPSMPIQKPPVAVYTVLRKSLVTCGSRRSQSVVARILGEKQTDRKDQKRVG